MEEKLKLILKQIHWSSLLKAALFAAGWFFLPFWLFALLALYLYFVPFSEARKVLGPFLVLILLMAFEPVSLVFALIFGVIFLYILLIKNLFLIDRKSAYEILLFFLSFILLRDFYARFGQNPGGLAFLYAFGAAFIMAILFGSFISCFWEPSTGERSFRRIVSWLSFLVSWQLLVAGLFLPLDFSYQGIVVFLIEVLAIDFLAQYVFEEASPKKMLTSASVVFIVLALILGSARWTL